MTSKRKQEQDQDDSPTAKRTARAAHKCGVTRNGLLFECLGCPFHRILLGVNAMQRIFQEHYRCDHPVSWKMLVSFLVENLKSNADEWDFLVNTYSKPYSKYQAHIHGDYSEWANANPYVMVRRPALELILQESLPTGLLVTDCELIELSKELSRNQIFSDAFPRGVPIILFQHLLVMFPPLLTMSFDCTERVTRAMFSVVFSPTGSHPLGTLLNEQFAQHQTYHGVQRVDIQSSRRVATLDGWRVLDRRIVHWIEVRYLVIRTWLQQVVEMSAASLQSLVLNYVGEALPRAETMR